jgi:hypothetical protein
MSEQKTNTNTNKIIIILLSLGLIGSLYYNYTLNNELSNSKLETKNELSEKEIVLKDLEALKDSYSVLINEKTTLNDELVTEKNKVLELISQVKKSTNDLNILKKYKEQLKILENKYETLIRENESLKKLNQQLVTKVDSTTTILIESQEYSKVLAGQNEELAQTVVKGSKLSILNLKTAAYKVKNSGKEIETEKARRADILKVSFTIAENAIANSGDKQYFVQIIDSKNNVLGEKKDIVFGDKTLTYSFISKVNYQNKNHDVMEILKGEGFEKGNYFVNIFDKDQLVANTIFVLE